MAKFARTGIEQLLKMIGPQQPKTLANPSRQLVEGTAQTITPQQAIDATDIKPEFLDKKLPFTNKWTGEVDYSNNASEYLSKANNPNEMRLRLNSLLHNITTYDDVTSWVQGPKHFPFADGVRDEIRGAIVPDSKQMQYYDEVIRNRKLQQIKMFREKHGPDVPLPDNLIGLE
jgi:hypothetical protein